jgi:tRNA dimethylallyltransferase
MNDSVVKPLAVAIMGPTASGKTASALAIAQRIPSEIISVDSALVYRGMDIGTAKPTREELAAAPHHLIDIIDPLDVYSVAQFRADTLRLVDDIVGRGKLPLLVGGTMLYFKGLADGLDDLPGADPALRAELEDEAAAIGWPAMHATLALLDPETGAQRRPAHPERAGDLRAERQADVRAAGAQGKDGTAV